MRSDLRQSRVAQRGPAARDSSDREAPPHFWPGTKCRTLGRALIAHVEGCTPRAPQAGTVISSRHWHVGGSSPGLPGSRLCRARFKGRGWAIRVRRDEEKGASSCDRPRPQPGPQKCGLLSLTGHLELRAQL